MPRKTASHTKKIVAKTSAQTETPKVATSNPVNWKPIIAVGVIVVVILAALLIKNQLLVASVNGTPITRFKVIAELEKQGGKSVVDTLVTKILVEQEAKKQNISVSDQEISDEVKKIEANVKGQGQTLDQLLATNNTTREGLSEEIRTQKLVEKLLAKDIQVSDKEIEDYITQNKDYVPAGTDEQKLKADVKQQLVQQKLQTKFQAWIGELKTKAKINYFKTY